MNATSRIPLNGRQGVVAYALVDSDDAELLGAHHWYRKTDGYAARNSKERGSWTLVLMHREIAGLKAGDSFEVDHINRNKLDNRRANLRVVTRSQNAQNMPSRAGSSRFRGVVWRGDRNKWRARVRIDGKDYHVGYFVSEGDAAAAASAFRREHMPFAVEAAA